MSTLLFEPIKEKINPASEIPLCLWTFLSSENLLTPEILEKMVFINKTHQENAELNDGLNSLIDHVFLPDIATWLNQKHKTNHPFQFWAILLKPWIGFVVNASYYYFLLLEQYFKEYPEKVTVTLLELDSDWEFKDTDYFIRHGHLSTNFHQFLITEILRGSYSDKIKHEKVSPFSPPLVDVSNGFESIQDHRSRRCIKIPGMSTIAELLLSLLLTLKPAVDTPSHDPIFVSKDDQFSIPETLRSTITECLKRSIPLSFTRYYEDYQKRAEKINYKKGKLRVFGAVSSTFEQMKFYLANAKAQGEILITTQHGGNYGLHLSHWEPQLFEYRFHHFITWGWTSKPDQYANKIALPSPYMKQFKNRHKFKNNTVIFIGTDINPLLYGFIPSFFEGKKCLEYRDDKLKFLNQLSQERLKTVAYRAYPNSRNRFSDNEYIRSNCPDLTLLEGDWTTLHKALFNSKLCVMDHLGTSLLICLSANVPFICFWRESFCDLNDEGRALIETLKEDQLFFDDAKEAADFVNSLSNVESWWKSKQALRATLMNYYANNNDWFMPWLKKLLAI
ncbi:hypothetical protein DID80_01170 [Candidatus Marinamargulisbacteria bacterium SCGC AAA071-K20]|nr:hypothetical protein DID80_01170 [Candidatus Marinamargulisbacteria bacterium SCGC AAA071-K20]